MVPTPFKSFILAYMVKLVKTTKRSGHTKNDGWFTYFPEADLAVPVLVHLFNHRFQSQMSLWGL